VFIEGVGYDWTTVAFVDGHGASSVISVVALTLFLSGWAPGRLFGGRPLDRWGRRTALQASFACVVLGSLLVVTGTMSLALIGIALWGAGASLGFPVPVSTAADDPGKSAARISVVSTIGYGAFLAGPALVGFLANHVGIREALLAATAAAVFGLLIVPAVFKRQPPTTPNSRARPQPEPP